MARKPASLADRLRAHREEMVLAMELGCTPREARAELDRRTAWQRHQQLLAQAKAAGFPISTKISAPGPEPQTEAERPTPWWQRD